jgi:hypothetical protein
VILRYLSRVSRHRSPGRTAPARSARHRAAPALRNGLSAAAVTGGALAVLVPTIPVAAAPSTALALTTADARVPAAGPVPVLRIASLVPVRDAPAPVPPTATVGALLKSAGLGEIARRAEEREAAARCDTGLGGLGRVKPWVRDAARFLSCLHGEPTLIGVAGRSRQSDHPAGLAVDFMMTGARGDRLAACALANRAALGVDYVIWKQRINYGDGWEAMEDRGGATENHFDHVHVSFERAAGDGGPLAALCT